MDKNLIPIDIFVYKNDDNNNIENNRMLHVWERLSTLLHPSFLYEQQSTFSYRLDLSVIAKDLGLPKYPFDSQYLMKANCFSRQDKSNAKRKAK